MAKACQMRSFCCLWVVCLATGCAGIHSRAYPPALAVQPGTGGSGPPAEAEDDEAWASTESPDPRWTERGDEARRQAELQAAIEQLSRVAGASNREGAQVNFELWACNGALTLDSWNSSVPAHPTARESSDASFKRALGWQPGDSSPPHRGLLELASRQGPALLHLSLRRTATGWTLGSISRQDAAQLPPEARTLPIQQPPVPAADWEAAAMMAGELVRNLRAPGNPGAERPLAVELEDGRIQRLSTVSWQPGGTLSNAPSEAPLAWELANALVPFIQGLGKRTVKVRLRAEQLPNQTSPHWRVAGAAVLHSPQAVPDEGLTIAEYRHIHEVTLRQWREDTRHYAEVAARYTAREVAIWVASGWALHGVGAVVQYTASPVWRVLTQGGPMAEGWLECVLRRIPRAERGPLRRLWAKVDLEGLKALTEAEEKALSTILQRFEKIALTPLTEQEKEIFREIARTRFWKNLNPELAARLAINDGKFYEIHHLTPLEYAELFVEMDINATENLVAVARDVHYSISRLWTEFRKTRGNATPADVQRMVTIINQQYSQWYNTAYNPAASAALLQSTEASVRVALQNLFKGTPR